MFTALAFVFELCAFCMSGYLMMFSVKSVAISLSFSDNCARVLVCVCVRVCARVCACVSVHLLFGDCVFTPC